MLEYQKSHYLAPSHCLNFDSFIHQQNKVTTIRKMAARAAQPIKAGPLREGMFKANHDGITRNTLAPHDIRLISEQVENCPGLKEQHGPE